MRSRLTSACANLASGALAPIAIFALVATVGCQWEQPFVAGPPCDSAWTATELVRASDRESTDPQAPPVVVAASHTQADSDPSPEEVPAGAPVVEQPAVPVGAETLSLETLQEMALINNPSVARAQAQVDALWGNWQQVGLLPNPLIGYQAEEMGDDGTWGQQGGFVGQTFVRGGKLALNRCVAQRQIDQAQWQLAAQQTRVLTDVRIGYNTFLIACRQVSLAEELVTIAAKASQDTGELLRRGEVPRADLLRAEAEAASVEILLTNARNEQLAGWRRLAAVVGVYDLPLPEVQEGFLQEKLQEAAATAIEYESALTRLLAENPELAAAMMEIERARAAVDRAAVEAVPDINVQASVRHDNAGSQTLAGVSAGLPIPIFDRNQGGIHRAHAQLIAAERAYQALELSLRRQFEAVFQRYANARNQVQQYLRPDDGILAKTKESLRLTTLGYEAGEYSSLEMLTAQRTFNQANIAYITALQQLWSAAAEIEGLLLTGSLDTP
jgi:cobalt-zinc-cadmium efflux system outer membrane protein